MGCKEDLFKICENLKEEHILETFKKYHDDLTKDNDSESYYIKYNGEYYKLNPTIRYAINDFLNNSPKILPNNNNASESDKKYIFTSEQFKALFLEKFSNSDKLMYIYKIKNSTDFINFERIIYFLKKYKNIQYTQQQNNNKYTNINMDIVKREGQFARREFEKFAKYIISHFNNLSQETHQWKAEWHHIYDYLWIEIKNKDFLNKLFSISIAINVDKNNNPHLAVKTETTDKTSQEDLCIFNKAIDIPTDTTYYNVDDKTYEDYNEVLQVKDNAKKIQIVYDINPKYISTETNRIIEETVQGVRTLLPNYNYIVNYQPNGEKNMEKQPLNLILYGPPGTGKTYNTVVKAMKIIGIPESNKKAHDALQTIIEQQNSETPKNTDNEYKIVKKEFDTLKQQKQIEFITFHQSYSYEEFVEGIKPYIPQENWCDDDSEIENDDNSVKYIGKKGIFRKICKRAQAPIVENKNGNMKIKNNPNIWKVSLMKAGDNPVREDCLNNNRIRIGFDVYGEDITEENEFKHKGRNVLNAFINKMDIGDLVISCYSKDTLDAVGVITSDYKWNNKWKRYKRYRDVKWLWVANEKKLSILSINKGLTFTTGTVYKLNNIDLGELLKITNIKQNNVDIKNNDKKYVLIIDEINRGNISKIFGELITLIEEDKRECVNGIEPEKYNTIKVTLPYSGDTFSVPNNLYIIGTMNTADRSIALLDTALRRRFEFEEMPPKSGLLKDLTIDGETISLKTFLDNLNENIRKKGNLDKDHKIGHAFLMNLGTEKEQKENLRRAFLHKIYPLLEEYFYDDEDKIKEVLGNPGKTVWNKFNKNKETWLEIVSGLAKNNPDGNDE